MQAGQVPGGRFKPELNMKLERIVVGIDFPPGSLEAPRWTAGTFARAHFCGWPPVHPGWNG